jgi:hypothetical protein
MLLFYFCNYLAKHVLRTTLVTSFPRRQKDFYGCTSFFCALAQKNDVHPKKSPHDEGAKRPMSSELPRWLSVYLFLKRKNDSKQEIGEQSKLFYNFSPSN